MACGGAQEPEAEFLDSTTVSGPEPATSSSTTSDGSPSDGSPSGGSEGSTGGEKGSGGSSSGPIPAACDESGGAGQTGGGDDTGLGMDGDPPLLTDIFAIQDDDVSPFTWVSVEDVVVTSPVADGVAPSEDDMFTIADPKGGLYSGITVRVVGGASVGPGDRVSLEGSVRRRDSFWEIRTDAERISVEGKGPMPPPVVLDLETLQGFLAGQEAVRPYDSVVVALPTSETEAEEGCEGELRLSYGDLRVDDRFLVATGDALPIVNSLPGVRGPLLYTVNGFEVAPRSLDDLSE